MAATKPPSPRPRSRPKVQPTLAILVRHGTTPTTGQLLPGRAPGLYLADSGTAQAEKAAERISQWVQGAKAGSPLSQVAGVWASPMERTRQTAAPISKALGLRTRTTRNLIECDFGEWTGRKLSELARLPEWEGVQRHPSGFRFPGGESFLEMQARICGGIRAICADNPGKTVVLVSHADPIKAAVSEAMGTHLDQFQRIVISPCSISVISYAPIGPTVLAVNSTGSLEELKIS